MLGRLHLPQSQGEQRALDLPGGVLIGASLLAIVAGISSGNTAGWGSVRVLGALVVGVLLLAAFLRREQRVAAPMIELKLFTVRTFRVADSIGFLMNLGTMGSIFFLTQFMQNVLKASPLQAGLETMPWTGTIMLVAPLTGWLTKRLGRRAVVLAGMLAQTVVLVRIGTLAAATVPKEGMYDSPNHFTPLDPATLAELRQRYEYTPNVESRTRYQMLLLAHQEYKVPQITRMVLRSEDTVARVLNRF